jgi:hypothetical protein
LMILNRIKLGIGDLSMKMQLLASHRHDQSAY